MAHTMICAGYKIAYQAKAKLFTPTNTLICNNFLETLT